MISGIGFLGAGTILVTGRQEVRGLTTAASLWTCACVGLAIGAGYYECAGLSFCMILLSTRILPGVERRFVEKSRNLNLYLEMDSVQNIGEILEFFKRVAEAY